jgi:hypothetical protein
MYSAATHEMSEALRLGFLSVPAQVFLYAALAAWAAAFIGLLRWLVRHRFGLYPAQPPSD